MSWNPADALFRSQAISTLRATASMAMDDQGVVMSNMANIVPADKDSIAFSRTPAQVPPPPLP